MVLKAVSLTKSIGSDNWYYRRAIPADIQRILRDRSQDSRPQGWYRTHISISLRTSDRNVARTRSAVAAAHAERLIADLRGIDPVLAEPTESRSTTGVPTARGMRITALADAWHNAALNRGVRERDAERKAFAAAFRQKKAPARPGPSLRRKLERNEEARKTFRRRPTAQLRAVPCKPPSFRRG